MLVFVSGYNPHCAPYAGNVKWPAEPLVLSGGIPAERRRSSLRDTET